MEAQFFAHHTTIKLIMYHPFRFVILQLAYAEPKLTTVSHQSVFHHSLTSANKFLLCGNISVYGICILVTWLLWNEDCDKNPKIDYRIQTIVSKIDCRISKRPWLLSPDNRWRLPPLNGYCHRIGGNKATNRLLTPVGGAVSHELTMDTEGGQVIWSRESPPSPPAAMNYSHIDMWTLWLYLSKSRV